MNNQKIRTELKKTGVKYWQLAKIMRISDGTLCRRLREEIPDEEQERICELIRQYSGGGEKKNDN